MARLVFDLESNGLIGEMDRIHCLVTNDLTANGHYQQYVQKEVSDALVALMEADEVIGHNVIGFDIPAIQSIYPWFNIDWTKVTDTLVMARFIFPDIGLMEAQKTRKKTPWPVRCTGRDVGSHSLRAWGIRLKHHKGDYEGGWAEFNPEMLSYNVQDVVVTTALYEFLLLFMPEGECFKIEHHVATICARQERHGWHFDMEKANALAANLMATRAELDAQLTNLFPPWTIEEVFIPKVNNKARGYEKGVPFIKKHTVVFNPNSRQHIADRLFEKYKWKPKKYTENGSPVIDETVLNALPYPEAKMLAESFLIQKRIGMLAEGANAWLKLVQQGRIHGRVLTNGAVTGRATHRNPNVAQVPSVKKPYGWQCRELFKVPYRKKLVGIDASGLELRMLGHFMALFDGGAYAKEVVDGDVHTVNMKAAGLTTRDQAKTFIYAFLYGAGPELIGLIAGLDREGGEDLIERFKKNLPALDRLIKAVKHRVKTNKYLTGLDGRKLPVRSAHAALNVLLQSAGAIVCKKWMMLMDEEIERRDWRHKVQQVGWIHDECQFECDEDIAEEWGKIAVDCIVRVGLHFALNCPLDGEFKVGNNWAETH